MDDRCRCTPVYRVEPCGHPAYIVQGWVEGVGYSPPFLRDAVYAPKLSTRSRHRKKATGNEGWRQRSNRWRKDPSATKAIKNRLDFRPAFSRKAITLITPSEYNALPLRHPRKGIPANGRIRGDDPSAGQVLVVTAGVDAGVAAELIRSGISGVFRKHDSAALLHKQFVRSGPARFGWTKSNCKRP